MMNTKRSFKCTYRAAMPLTPVIRPLPARLLFFFTLLLFASLPVAAQTGSATQNKNFIHQIGIAEKFNDIGSPNTQTNLFYTLHYKYVEISAGLLYDTPGLRKQKYKNYGGGNIQLTLFLFEKRRVIEPYLSFGYSHSVWKTSGFNDYLGWDSTGTLVSYHETTKGDYKCFGIVFEPGLRFNAGRFYADIVPLGIEDPKFQEHFTVTGGTQPYTVTADNHIVTITHKIGIAFRMQSRSEVLKYGDAY